jgi:hypothetical protein
MPSRPRGRWNEVVGHVEEGDCDVGESSGAEPVDGEAMQGGHIVWAVSGVDGRGVLAAGGVADVV